jgi:hypothetical protein
MCRSRRGGNCTIAAGLEGGSDEYRSIGDGRIKSSVGNTFIDIIQQTH